jgi:hypothetical protein
MDRATGSFEFLESLKVSPCEVSHETASCDSQERVFVEIKEHSTTPASSWSFLSNNIDCASERAGYLAA